MRITQWDPADTAALSGCKAAWDAAQDIDDPDGSPTRPAGISRPA
jgi:hypothetical protein